MFCLLILKISTSNFPGCAERGSVKYKLGLTGICEQNGTVIVKIFGLSPNQTTYLKCSSLVLKHIYDSTKHQIAEQIGKVPFCFPSHSVTPSEHVPKILVQALKLWPVWLHWWPTALDTSDTRLRSLIPARLFLKAAVNPILTNLDSLPERVKSKVWFRNPNQTPDQQPLQNSAGLSGWIILARWQRGGYASHVGMQLPGQESQCCCWHLLYFFQCNLVTSLSGLALPGALI